MHQSLLAYTDAAYSTAVCRTQKGPLPPHAAELRLDLWLAFFAKEAEQHFYKAPDHLFLQMQAREGPGQRRQATQTAEHAAQLGTQLSACGDFEVGGFADDVGDAGDRVGHPDKLIRLQTGLGKLQQRARPSLGLFARHV